jgi:hypothetical protein
MSKVERIREFFIRKIKELKEENQILREELIALQKEKENE